MKVLIADKFEDAGLQRLREAGHDVRVDPDLGPETLPAALDSFAPGVLVVRSTKVPRAVIEHARSLGAIIRAGAGYDNIDIQAAGEAGIPVANCPGTNAVAVAELAMGLLICCDRRIPDQTAELRQGRWNKKEYASARGLKGSTLGLVGYGAIGRAMAARASAFEMRVLAWSPRMDGERAGPGVENAGRTREDLLRMLGRCDAVSVHIAATPDTRGMGDAEFFNAMRDGAYFINTSRGSVVDEAALRDAIERKAVRAGLDVYQDQPAEKDTPWKTPLADLPGVYTTHHCGASTDQAQLAVAEETCRLIDALEKSGSLEHCVNEDFLAAAKR